MEKPREMVKRGSSGRVFSSPTTTKKQQQHLKQHTGALNGNGDMGIHHKSKKDKVRGFRVNSTKQDCEMGGGYEGEEEELKPTSSKRFKLQTKSFKGSNAVVHLTVPRKLRSAMNKRSRESLSPPLHLISNGMEASQMNGRKNSEQNMKQGDSDGSPQTKSISITKDEEEVVETLFSLARMPPITKGTVEEQISENNLSPLPEKMEITVLALEAPKEKNILVQHECPEAESVNLSSNVEGSAEEASKITSLPESSIIDQRPVHENQKLDLNLSTSMSLTDRAMTSQPPMTVLSDNISLIDATKSSFELSRQTGSVKLANHEGSLNEKKLESGMWRAVNILNKEEQQPIKEKTESSALPPCMEDPSLWPDMSTMPSHGGVVHAASTLSFSTKLPPWLDSANSSTRPCSTATNASTEKMVMVERRKKWKKCMTHVHISRMIQTYQDEEKKFRCPIPPTEIKPNENTKLDAATTKDLPELRGASGVVSAGSANLTNKHITVGSPNCSGLGKSSNDVLVGNVQGKMLQQDNLSSTSSGIYSAGKQQNYNFLSLSTCDGGSEPVPTTNNNNNPRPTGLESSTQAHMPYLHPNFHHHPLMPYSVPHARYASSSQLQLPQYVGGHLYCPPHPSFAGSQKHNQMWATQLAAAQYRPGGGITGSHYPKWQNGRYEPPSLVPCSQPSHPSSSSPLEVIGTKYSPGPHQQQQFFALSSTSSSRGSRQHHHPVPGSFNINGSGGFHSEDSSQLQLVCNTEH